MPIASREGFSPREMKKQGGDGKICATEQRSKARSRTMRIVSRNLKGFVRSPQIERNLLKRGGTGLRGKEDNGDGGNGDGQIERNYE